MSLEIITEQIIKFLKSSEPEVLAIRGKFGIGKTYTWNQLLKEHKVKIALSQYSYASLFGINSLEELKTTIFANIIDKALIGETVDIKTLAKNSYEVMTSFSRKWKDALKGIPTIGNFSKIIDAACFVSIKNLLICIDDFERKGKNLDLRDILGLVSMLKEQKKCKLILIFNEDAFEENDTAEYKKFREKVIDKELLFDPTPKECCEIAFCDNGILQNEISGFACQLKINNIRVLKKIDLLAIELKAILQSNQCREETIQQALQSLCLLCLCFYSKDKNLPDFNWLKNIGFNVLYQQKEASSEEKIWLGFLKKHNVIGIDGFDLSIAEGIESGYFNANNLIQEAKKLDRQLEHNIALDTLKKSWDPYTKGFDHNETEVIASLKTCLHEHYEIYTPAVLDPAICLIRDLNRNDIAKELIDFYLEKISENDEMKKNLMRDFGMAINGIRDNELREKINSFLSTELLKDQKSPRDILYHIYLHKSWGTIEEDILANTAPDAFYEIFKNEKEDLHSIVDAALSFGKSTPAKESYKKIDANVKAALTRIAQESPLNQKRVETFGFSINSINDKSTNEQIS